MLISVRLNNINIFDREIEFSMCADMRQKRFSSNVITGNCINIVKTALIIGPNNAGKTNFIKGIRGIKGILLNQGFSLMAKNIFSDDEISEFRVEFLENNKIYSFEVKLCLQRSEVLYERFVEIIYDKYKNKKERIIYIRDNISSEYACDNEELKNSMEVVARNNLLFYLLDTSKFDVLQEAKNHITLFASSIDTIDMNNIPIQKTIDMMKSNKVLQKKISNFVVNADLSMDDFRYLSDDEVAINLNNTDNTDDVRYQENALAASAPLIEMLHLSSRYNGVQVPSIFYDSAGTKKIAALAGYIIDALEHGRILVVDEIDNSLHFKLTRAIIAMFNNDLNNKAQLICTTHDVSLLDCKKLLRKEQIWFAHKDKDGVYLYSLAEFTADKDKVRDTTDLIEKYKMGVFGAIPEPDLFNSLQEVYTSV